MKLLERYSRVNLTATIIVYIAVSISFYFLFNTILIDLIDKDLRIEQNEIIKHVKRDGKLPEIIGDDDDDQIIRYTITTNLIQETSYSYIKSKILKGVYRKLSFGILVKGTPYNVTVLKPLEEKRQLMTIIFQVTLIAFAIVLLIHFLINRTFTRKLWKPFYNTLKKVNDFELNQAETIKLETSSITEFQMMNASFSQTLDKAQKDYLLLKEFTEDASHELQTPLSIIRSKLDLLIQETDLSENQLRFAQGAYQALQRLARLNQSLLLLMKIKNGQFAQFDIVDLKQKTEDKLHEFEELIASKSLEVIVSLHASKWKINASLCDILLNNMLSNAIEHNIPFGIIKIELSENKFEISNPGYNEDSLDNEKLFKRFIKSDTRSQRTGLGLAIVKEICDASNIKVEYTFDKGFHAFRFHQKK